MPHWNCRLVQKNGDAKDLPWLPIEAHNPQRAAVAYCDVADVWDCAHWCADDEATVEVEGFGGESGIHRMTVRSYNNLVFCATPEDEE